MNEKIKNLQRRLNLLTEILTIMSRGHCKGAEPVLSISIGRDMKWNAEIYSYLMDFHDGGRHHHFEADTLEMLLSDLDAAIVLEEVKVIDMIADMVESLENLDPDRYGGI